jgi:hypothetical protein
MGPQGWLAVIVITTIALCITVLLPILLAFRESGRKVELDHAARMKAIELGRSLPREDTGQDEPWTMAARLAMAIGVVVPLGSLGCAFLASLALGFHQDMWVAGGMVGLAGVLCGGLLAGHTFGASKSTLKHANDKPYLEDDAYDVVGARG